jgi:hypothetical protein
MDAMQYLGEASVAERALLRGMIVRDSDDGGFVVLVGHGVEEWIVYADVLVSSESPVRLNRGDRVLCSIDIDDRERGVILGRIGAKAATSMAAPPPSDAPMEPRADVPDTLVIEAKESLTLRVGAGSITIRGDGKILIKGKDLVSHAQRVNRIKGGSVAIN